MSPAGMKPSAQKSGVWWLKAPAFPQQKMAASRMNLWDSMHPPVLWRSSLDPQEERGNPCPELELSAWPLRLCSGWLPIAQAWGMSPAHRT